MKPANFERRLAEVARVQQEQAVFARMRRRDRLERAVAAITSFARDLVLAAMPPAPPPIAGLPEPQQSSSAEAAPSPLTPEEARAAEVKRLRPLLKGYQIDSCKAMKLIARYPELGIVEGWTEPEPPPRPPSWAKGIVRPPPHPDDPMGGGGFIRPSYYVSPK